MDELRELLAKLPGPYFAAVDRCEDELLAWALANHLLRIAIDAARPGGSGPERLLPWLSGADHALASVGSPVVVDAANSHIVEVGADARAYSVDPAALLRGASPQGTKVTAEAFSAIDRVGYGDVLDQALAVVVLLDRKDLGTEVSSWTTTALPSTIYLDWYPTGELLGKDLLHEATHAWLNDAIDARQVEFPPEELYYSPWKERHRPAYGMLHSVIAFSRVTNYLARLHGVTEDAAVREYCRIRVDQESARLRSVRDSTYATFSVTPDPEIVALVRDEYEQAVDAPALLT